MIGEWVVYALLVSALLAAAGWLADHGLRALGRSGRVAWAAAMAASVAVPLWAWLMPSPSLDPAPLVGVPGAYVLETIPLGAGPVSSGPTAAAVFLGGWLSVSLLLLVAVTGLAVRLWLRGRGWERRTVDGVDVLVSRRTGPAAVGLLRARVVVPDWTLELEAAQRRMLLLHEAEHVRARDPQLAFAGLLLCIVAPWNLPLWWQLRRLRLAIEMDCDARVLRRTTEPRTYGSLLLAVGQRRAHLALGLAESPSMLERRIRMISRRTSGRTALAGLGLLAVSGLVLAAACETPGPTDAPESAGVIEAREGAPDGAGPEGGPGSDLVTLDGNGSVGVAAGSCAAVYVDGRRSSMAAARALDTGTIDRIEVMKGEAASLAGDEGAGESCGLIWIVTDDAPADVDAKLREMTHPGTGATPPAEAGRITEMEQAREAGPMPTFTPMTTPPGLTNAEEVQELLQTRYPPLLRNAGIEGTATVWLLIGPDGQVETVRLKDSAGHDALDAAALSVAREMEFTPALNREEPVQVWVALDMAFEVR